MARTPTRRSHRWIRRTAIALAVGFLAVAIVVVFAGPTIIAALVPAIVGGLGLPGHVEVEGVSLSWRGELAVGRATIFDPADEHVATVSARTSGGLLGLLDGRLDRDITVNGWATIEIDEDGSTNIEKALGLERGSSNGGTASPAEPMGPLPFGKIVIDRVDASLSRAGSPTLAIAGFTGEARADGSRLVAEAKGALALPANPPKDRATIENAPAHGAFTLSADLELDTLTGTATARMDDLSPEAALALGNLSGDDTIAQAAMVAARGGLTLDAAAALDAGAPSRAMVTLQSQTVQATLAAGTKDGAIQLESPGSIGLDTAAFLANDAIRQRTFPGQGVSVSQAGHLTLDIEKLSVPMRDASPALEEARARVTLRLAPTALEVPGPEGQPLAIRVSSVTASAAVEPGSPLTLNAQARASVTGQPEGDVSISARIEPPAAMDLLAPDAALGVTGLTRALPSATVELRNVPTMAAKPWLAALDAMGLDVQRIAGDSITASLAWSAAQDDTAGVRLRVDAPHLRASADARWAPDAISLVQPLTIGIDRPDAIAAAWLPEGWAMQSPGGVRASVEALTLPMEGLRPDLSAATANAAVTAQEASVTPATGPALGVRALDLRVATAPGQTTLRLTSQPTAGGHAGTLTADLRTAGLPGLLEAGTDAPPAVLGVVELAAPAELAGVLDMPVAGRPLQQWIAEAVGPRVTARLDLAEPSEGQNLAGTLAVRADHASLDARGIGLSTDALRLEGAKLTATPSAQLWQGLAPILKLEGSTLAQTSPLYVELGPAALQFGESATLASGLNATSVALTMANPIRIQGVPTGPAAESGERPRADVAIPTLEANLNSVGAILGGGSDVRAGLNLVLESPGQGRIAKVEGQLQPEANGAVGVRLVVDEVDTQRVSMIAGLGGGAAEAIQGALGAKARVDVRAAARPDAGGPAPWAIQTAALDIKADRLSTASPIETQWTPDAATLAKPATLTWTPDAQWLESAIGARVTSVQPLQITLDRIALGNPLAGQVALLDPSTVAIDAALSGTGATIAIQDRPSIELQTIQARIRRIAQNTFGLTGKAATANGGTLELNGLIERLTNDQGQPSLESAEVRGTLKGNKVPVALADALSNTDGLLADSLGDVVDLDAEISRGRMIPGQPPQADLRFSVRGPRADASGYGRLADHAITMTEPQTILTVREVRPEIAQRFSQIIPELLMVEKRPEDGPAVVRTQGLTIPTNGDWSRGQGQATVALGTARFRTSSVLSGVLKATGQREKGSLGRRIDPINITMVDGVITYQPFDLPLGDLTLQSEGTVNLPANTMDVLVWIPMAALSDEAAGKFNTGLGSAIGRSVPVFGSATTVPWRVSGPLNSPDIRPAPRVLIERRGSQILGPLLRPGESLQDLLSIPRRREQPEGGG